MTSTNQQIVTRTRNAGLQRCLDDWTNQLATILSQPSEPHARYLALDAFARTFVPPDVDEEDIAHYAQSLASDTEFFESLVREIQQCASGQGVESIEGDQKRKAVFTLLPPEGLLTEGSDLDIVRELGFISIDGAGDNWRAEA